MEDATPFQQELDEITKRRQEAESDFCTYEEDESEFENLTSEEREHAPFLCPLYAHAKDPTVNYLPH